MPEAKRFSRRRLPFVVGGGVAGILGGGLLAEHTSHHGKYQGEIKDLKGKEYITDDKLKQLTDALRATNQPILRKIGEDISSTHTSQSNPDDFPFWVSQGSLPLPITYDVVTKTSRAIAAAAIRKDPAPDAEFHYDVGKGLRTDYAFDRYLPGIHLEVNTELRALGPLAEGLYLAKEYITSMLYMKMADESYDLSVIGNDVKYLNAQNLPLTDREKQVKAGARIFFNGVSDHTGMLWKGLDGLPILLVCAAAKQLIVERKIPADAPVLQNVYIGVDILRTPDTSKIVNDINQRWVEINGHLPPDGITEQTFSEPLYPSLSDLEKRQIT